MLTSGLLESSQWSPTFSLLVSSHFGSRTSLKPHQSLKFLCSNSDYSLSLPKPSLSPKFSLLNLTSMEFNCTQRKLHNGNVNYHSFGLYGLFFGYPWLPLNHLGFLCLSTFMLKELLAKRKFTLGLPRFEPTTMQCQTQCQTI